MDNINTLQKKSVLTTLNTPNMLQNTSNNESTRNYFSHNHITNDLIFSKNDNEKIPSDQVNLEFINKYYTINSIILSIQYKLLLCPKPILNKKDKDLCLELINSNYIEDNFYRKALNAYYINDNLFEFCTNILKKQQYTINYQDSQDAEHWLGFCHEFGIGTTKNLFLSTVIYEKLSKQKHSQSAARLFFITKHMTTTGQLTTLKYIADHLLLSNKNIIFALAESLYKNNNIEGAVFYYLQAVMLEHPEAAYKIADIYWNKQYSGNYISMNTNKYLAIKYYIKSANYCFPKSIDILAFDTEIQEYGYSTQQLTKEQTEKFCQIIKNYNQQIQNDKSCVFLDKGILTINKIKNDKLSSSGYSKNPEEFVKTANNYFYGNGVTKNLDLAIYMYTIIIEANSTVVSKKLSNAALDEVNYNIATYFENLYDNIDKNSSNNKDKREYKKSALSFYKMLYSSSSSIRSKALYRAGQLLEKDSNITKSEQEDAFWCYNEARYNNNEALYRLAQCYENGTGTNLSIQEAFICYQILEKNLAKTHPKYAEVCYKLGYYYLNATKNNNSSLDQNNINAFKFFNLSYNHCPDNNIDNTNIHALSAYAMGYCYQYGIGVIIDNKSNIRPPILYFIESLNSGNLSATYGIANWYFLKSAQFKFFKFKNKEKYDESNDPYLKKALKYLTNAANQKNSHAQLQLGRYYKNINKTQLAKKYFKQAKSNNNIEAIKEFGDYYKDKALNPLNEIKTEGTQSSQNYYKIKNLSKTLLSYYEYDTIVNHSLQQDENDILKHDGYAVELMSKKNNNIVQNKVLIDQGGNLNFINDDNIQKKINLNEIGYNVKVNNPLNQKDIINIKKFLDGMNNEIASKYLYPKLDLSYLINPETYAHKFSETLLTDEFKNVINFMAKKYTIPLNEVLNNTDVILSKGLREFTNKKTKNKETSIQYIECVAILDKEKYIAYKYTAPNKLTNEMGDILGFDNYDQLKEKLKPIYNSKPIFYEAQTNNNKSELRYTFSEPIFPKPSQFN
jgi:TPR repeat protein